MLTTMTSKGQLTLPKEIRDQLGLAAGAKLDFVLEVDGTIRVRPIPSDPLAVARILPAPALGRTGDVEIHAAIRKRAAARFVRSTK